MDYTGRGRFDMVSNVIVGVAPVTSLVFVMTVKNVYLFSMSQMR